MDKPFKIRTKIMNGEEGRKDDWEGEMRREEKGGMRRCGAGGGGGGGLC